MKIHATKPTIKSMNLIVPIDGLITIDEKGYADVSAKCAAALVKGTSDWEFVGGAPKAEKKEDPKPAEEATEKKPADAPAGEGEKEQETEQKEDETDGKKTLTQEELELLTVKELKETCKEAGWPEAEYKNLSKGLLIAYILKKANGAE